MSKVKRLPDDLANKIAAGEVVERPSSVVKELVENAVDAGAGRVRVDIDQGGATRITVADDGDGMTDEDALLALERHATSKIRSFDDLMHLTSFGFRGEALPSIASVSKLSLVTRPRHKSEGTRIDVEPNGTPRATPIGCAPGTVVEALDLFYNVPARRKFMKSTATESAHVGEALLECALARPEITFELWRDGKLARTYPRAKDRRERAADAAGGEHLHAVTVDRGDTHIEAFLSRPERSRAGAGSLHLVVNGRVVHDRGLARAVAQAYGSVLEPGRYPLGALYIDLPPELVDVNVHPQKAEVRFAAGRALFELVARELNAQLSQLLALPGTVAWSPWRTPSGSQIAVAVPTTTQKSADLEDARDAALAIAEAQAHAQAEANAHAYADADANAHADANADAYADGAASADGHASLPGMDFYAGLHFLAQSNATYLVCEARDGLYIIDQHAAAERVTFDRLRRGLHARNIAMQRLLIPELLDVTAAEAELVETRADDIAALGVELARVGPTSITVVAVPRMLKSAPERIARDLLAELGQKSVGSFSGAIDLVVATMACHGSIRAGDVISRDEAEALIASLRGVDFSGHCPHGRPIVLKMSWEELGRRVGR
jgi:DNA mismatch repair protein MutL